MNEPANDIPVAPSETQSPRLRKVGDDGRAVRVLVVEDEDDWQRALASMYRQILGPRSAIRTASDAREGEILLRAESVDILSIDLNLASKLPRDQQGQPVVPRDEHGNRVAIADGLQLLERAAQTRWARAAVLTTGMEGHIRALWGVVEDPERLATLLVSPQDFMANLFGTRGLVLNKRPWWDIPTNIRGFAKVIRSRLAHLLAPTYILRFVMQPPRAIILSEGTQLGEFGDDDALFLLALAKLHGEDFLSDFGVVEIFRGQREADELADTITEIAQREIDGFRRRLRTSRIDPKILFRRVRGQQGWVLGSRVTVPRGIGSVNVRARGGLDYRPDFPSRARERTEKESGETD